MQTSICFICRLTIFPPPYYVSFLLVVRVRALIASLLLYRCSNVLVAVSSVIFFNRVLLNVTPSPPTYHSFSSGYNRSFENLTRLFGPAKHLSTRLSSYSQPRDRAGWVFGSPLAKLINPHCSGYYFPQFALFYAGCPSFTAYPFSMLLSGCVFSLQFSVLFFRQASHSCKILDESRDFSR